MRRRIRQHLLAISIVGILIGSMMPLAFKIRLGTVSQDMIFPGTRWHMNPHRALHAAAFALVAALLLSLIARWRNRLLAAAAICILALGTEIAEAVAFRNGMEWRDVGDDVAGISTALLLIRPPKAETANPAASEK